MWEPFVLLLIGWTFCLCLHEFGHAATAYLGGDTSVKEKGYLSFNPFVYADPFLSLVLPLLFLLIGGFALPGGLVYVDRSLLRNRRWECLVALAGPGANLLLFCLMAAPFYFGWVDGAATERHWAWSVYAALAFFQVTAVFFNLIPIPPLDGYNAVSPFLPPGLREKMDGLRPYGFFILLFLVFGGGLEGLLRLMFRFTSEAGIPWDWVLEGVRMCRLPR